MCNDNGGKNKIFKLNVQWAELCILWIDAGNGIYIVITVIITANMHFVCIWMDFKRNFIYKWNSD